MGQQDLKIRELVDKIQRGEIRLPEMQRQYVWPATRVRDLLDSLYRGYPSGNILTWETDASVPTRAFGVAQENAQTTNYQLLLDGQQRLTSLSAILRGEPIQVGDRRKPIDILFNLDHDNQLETTQDIDEKAASEEEQMIVEEGEEDANEDELMRLFNSRAFIVKTTKLERLPQWVSVTEVFRQQSDTLFLKKAGITNMEDPRYEKYSKRLQQLRSIGDYSYRVHMLERDKSYEEVTEIFVRVNSLGAKLRSSDLALAQITATWRNSLQIFLDFQKECTQMGFNLDMAIHLKALIAFATGQSRFKTVSSLTQEELETAWTDAKEGLKFALNFLRSNTGIDSIELLSSPFLIVTLAFYGHYKGFKISHTEERQLRYWALIASAKGRYSRGSSETFLDQDLAAIRNGQNIDGLISLLRTQVGRLDIQAGDLENRNVRSAYFKTMFLAFRYNGTKDWRDQLVISLSHSGHKHSLQFHHIFPQDFLRKANVPNQKINDICNLSFISGHTNRKISNKPPEEYLPSIRKEYGEAFNEALSKQCIPTNENLWKLEHFDDFLQYRRETIASQLNAFLEQGLI
ncbi:MAG: DUF262 domain-containing protein [Alphaproteobacteria bacterium]|nr:MAG: DUF262 domain-containing protein [Alphaproteobacteria bacterium]